MGFGFGNFGTSGCGGCDICSLIFLMMLLQCCGCGNGFGMEVIDAGVPLLSMHAPTEIAAKPDIFEAQKFYHAFYLSD